MSLGTSPTAPSLLIPANPAFSPADSAPRGGILINVHRASEPTLSIESTFSGGHARRPSEPSSAIGDEDSSSPLPSPSIGTPSFNLSPNQSQSQNQANSNSKALKIRFAPLPDPRRPRSLSTGRNIAWTNQVGEDGEESRKMSIKDHDVDDDSYAVDDEEYDESEEPRKGYGAEDDDGDDGDENGKGARRWSKSMGLGSSWKGTKKLLTGKNPMSSTKDKDKDEIMSYGQGAPLKKSVSTGGFIGSSPFRWTAETERKNTMQGTSPPTVTSLLSSHRLSTGSTSTPSSSGHRRNSSLEPGGPSYTRRSTSPGTTPIKLMNGRVYGSRRASEAAEREKKLREKNEPAFVEWGSSHTAQQVTSEEGSGKGSFLGDNDDGGGMAWVKRRREERQRKEREERERKEREEAEKSQGEGEESPTAGVGLSSSQSSTSSLDLHSRPNEAAGNGVNTQGQNPTRLDTNLKTPAIATTDLPPTPIIRISDSEQNLRSPQTDTHTQIHSGARKDLSDADVFDVGPKGERMTPTPPNSSDVNISTIGRGKPAGQTSSPGEIVEERKEGDHVVQAMRIPSDSKARATAQSSRKKDQLTDPFGQESPTNENGSDDEDGEDEEEEEGDEEDDGDFDDDEEEEMDIRTTSSAAGVEVISRHK
ncbi:uncharacterized protein I303_103103 [Kwoniella dejecticola CBS 10117]|uniref:Uncharacterized protein n=1 Tax=Kwoniella dejecticola CBS 10117 TaxID=1296121 RepID=A0A1A6AAM0_9TREE|nr:uncharacterized protein I303_03123 [Kwoniella dejecticola CBS 10117]OBR87099.1 hypothetical protein I303_03123 [Kwoniella dejecticola CBS 10117]